MLVGLKEVIREGRYRKIAIGAFNTPNLECLLAVLNGAEKLNVPVIISHAQLHESVAPIDKIGRVMIELAKASSVNVCVHLDHGEDFLYCKKAIELGFTSVMIDCSTLEYEDNIKSVKEVTDYAHLFGIDVEAELGKLPNRESGTDKFESDKDLYTNPKLVKEYIESTGIDALAIAFGTAHGIYKVKPVLNMGIISQVREITDIPLVMHGGSGINDEQYKEVISRGIDKINYFSYMSYAGFDAAKEFLVNHSRGFYHDMALKAQTAMQENVERTLKVFSNLEN